MSVLTDWIRDFIFFPSCEGIEERVKAARRWTEPKSSCVRELIDSSPPPLPPTPTPTTPRAYFHFPYVVASLTSISVIPAFKYRCIDNLFKEAWPSDGKGALYLIKNDGINKYWRVEIQIHAFSVSVLDCDKWMVYNPATLRPETFLRLPMNMKFLEPSVSLEAVVKGKVCFCCWKLNHYLRSMYSGLSTYFGTPGVPSSEHPYVNTSSASELVQCIKRRRTSAAIKTQHYLIKCQNVKNDRDIFELHLCCILHVRVSGRPNARLFAHVGQSCNRAKNNISYRSSFRCNVKKRYCELGLTYLPYWRTCNLNILKFQEVMIYFNRNWCGSVFIHWNNSEALLVLT